MEVVGGLEVEVKLGVAGGFRWWCFALLGCSGMMERVGLGWLFWGGNGVVGLQRGVVGEEVGRRGGVDVGVWILHVAVAHMVSLDQFEICLGEFSPGTFCGTKCIGLLFEFFWHFGYFSDSYWHSLGLRSVLLRLLHPKP